MYQVSDIVNKVHCADCLEFMKDIPDKSIDLIIADPPYNINKAEWDKWKKQEDYINWLGLILVEYQRVLKDNGSLYLFHNDFKQMAEIQVWIKNNLKLMFKSLITIDKLDNNYIKDLYQTQNHFRNWLNLTEYILFYVNSGGCYNEWDKTGLERVKLDVNNFSTLRKYFYEMLCYIGKNNKQIEKDLGHRKAEHCFYVMPKKEIIKEIGQKADHCFRYGSTQWDLPTQETYQELTERYNLRNWVGFKEYESLRKEYESLRKEYESLRYTFNFKGGIKNLLTYKFRESKYKHPTIKPLKLIQDLIKCSSNEGNLILDSFLGSGTTAVACKELGRQFIGIEKDPEYCKIAEKRIANSVADKMATTCKESLHVQKTTVKDLFTVQNPTCNEKAQVQNQGRVKTSRPQKYHIGEANDMVNSNDMFAEVSAL